MSTFDEVLIDATKLGKKIPTSEYLEKGKYPIVDQGHAIIAGYHDNKSGLFNDVPAIIFGDHTRAVKYIDTPFFLGADGVKVLTPKERTNNCKYLYYQLLAANIPNTGYNRHFKWVKELSFIVPALEEQNHVVAVLDKITALLELRRQQLKKLDTLVKSQFIEMFGNVEKAFPLSDVGTITGGLTKNAKREKLELHLPYLRVANVFFAHIDTNEILEIGLTAEERDKTLLKDGDLLFVEGNGSPDQIGRVAIWHNEVPNCVHQNHLIKVRFDSGKVLPEFAMHYFMTQDGRNQIKKVAVSTSGLYTLSVSKIGNLVMPVPSLEQQERFVALAQQADKSKFAIQQSLEKLETLKKSLMQKYFG